MARLEEHYREMQDIEFTVEARSTCCRPAPASARPRRRSGSPLTWSRRAPHAGGGGRARRPGAARPAAPSDDRLGRRVRVAAKGLNASPGAATGGIVLDADRAQDQGSAGDAVILVRETTPDDIHGIIKARGVLTAHGGMTSHAAVVARPGWGSHCVSGCRRSRSTWARGASAWAITAWPRATCSRSTGAPAMSSSARCRSSRRASTETSRRSSAGRTGSVACACRRTPEDGVEGAEFGAEDRPLPDGAHVHGRGAPAPRPGDDHGLLGDERRAELERLLPFQQADFEGIFEAMARLPVTVTAARPAAAQFLPRPRRRSRRRWRAAFARSTRRTPCWGRAAAGSGCSTRRSTRCRCARSSGPPWQWPSGPTRRRSSRSCTRSSASPRSSGGCGGSPWTPPRPSSSRRHASSTTTWAR